MEIDRVSLDTVRDLIYGRYSNKVSDYVIIDCRYPYEFDGGHIRDAVNIHTCDQLIDRFFRPSNNRLNGIPRPPCLGPRKKASILIFHCEFSSQRAPDL